MSVNPGIPSGFSSVTKKGEKDIMESPVKPVSGFKKKKKSGKTTVVFSMKEISSKLWVIEVLAIGPNR